MLSQNNGGGMGGFDDSLKDAVVPISVKQLRDMWKNDTVYELNKPKFCLLGVVRQEKQEPTKIEFHLDDTSGTVRVEWFSEGYVFDGFSAGCYVKLFGEYTRTDDGPDFIRAFHVRPLSTFNEVTHHLIKCVDVHKTLLELTGGSIPIPQPSASASASVSHDAGAMQGDIDEDLQQVYAIPYGKEIHIALEGHEENGLHVDQILNQCPGGNRPDVLQALNKLSELGTLYTTIDEEHFAWAV